MEKFEALSKAVLDTDRAFEDLPEAETDCEALVRVRLSELLLEVRGMAEALVADAQLRHTDPVRNG